MTAQVVARRLNSTVDLSSLLDRPRSGRGNALTIEEVMLLPPRSLKWRQESKKHWATLRELRSILEWLAKHPGDGWQQRWVNAGADHDLDWVEVVPGQQPITTWVRTSRIRALSYLFLEQVILPSYDVLLAYGANTLYEHVRLLREPEQFTALTTAADARGIKAKHQAEALKAISKIVLHTGRAPSELTVDDVLEMFAWTVQHRHRSKPNHGLHPAWELLSDIGVTPPGSRLRHAVLHGRRSTADLVDDFDIRAREIRGVLIRYLDERRPALDYNSFRAEVSTLAGAFWRDVERHHPEIDTLHLSAEQAAAWRERVSVLVAADGTRRPRTDLSSIFTRVRTFYLDIQRWAIEDPSWVRWAVPSPVRRTDCRGFAKEQRAVQSRMHQRIRERLPHLPLLSDTAYRLREDAAGLLAAAERVEPGQEFEVDGRRFLRVRLKGDDRTSVYNRSLGRVHVRDLVTGVTEKLTTVEDERFWAWAMIETLRHTGVRIEELLELTQLAIVSYRLPDTNELIPLLQIVPSKSNEERLLLVSPELASVLATIVTRLRTHNDGQVPLIPRYDGYEREVTASLPYLFQRQRGSQRSVMSGSAARNLINQVLATTGLRDSRGEPLVFTPHDFRRMFATDAVTNGLPVHIAARLLGHASLDTTQAYIAVFQDDLVHTYRAFLTQRRATRPSVEYRAPTDAEWTEFQQHFQTRKLELGTCGRPYGSPCQHEHACIRCPVLRVDPRQRNRLAEIVHNLGDRITEARHNGWLGEVDGLTVSLHAATAKLINLDRTATRNHEQGPVSIGMPVLRS